MHFHGLHNNQGMLVDTPGYGKFKNNKGFANMNQKRRNLWFGSTLEYIKISSRVSKIYMCVSTLLGFTTNDL